MRKIERDNTGLMRPGQNLVVAGYAGYAGTIAIVRQKREELLQWFTKGYLDRIMENEDGTLSGNLERWKALGATECEPAGEGGILSALWNLSGAYMTGIEFSLRQIPVKQETIEVCNDIIQPRTKQGLEAGFQKVQQCCEGFSLWYRHKKHHYTKCRTQDEFR